MQEPTRKVLLRQHSSQLNDVTEPTSHVQSSRREESDEDEEEDVDDVQMNEMKSKFNQVLNKFDKQKQNPTKKMI